MLDFRTDTFLTVCETMNFTEAAKRLHITQPAVSQHIRFLEKEYNTRLFSYCNKQLYLTPAGEILRKRLMTMKNDQLAIMNEIRNESHKMESLSIGVTMTIGEYAIVDKIADFLIGHPEMNVHIHYGNTTQLSYNHQFNWWFIISPPKGCPTARPKGRISQALLLARYKAVPLESSFLDSSACSLIYFWTASSVIFPIVST